MTFLSLCLTMSVNLSHGALSHGQNVPSDYYCEVVREYDGKTEGTNSGPSDLVRPPALCDLFSSEPFIESKVSLATIVWSLRVLLKFWLLFVAKPSNSVKLPVCSPWLAKACPRLLLRSPIWRENISWPGPLPWLRKLPWRTEFGWWNRSLRESSSKSTAYAGETFLLVSPRSRRASSKLWRDRWSFDLWPAVLCVLCCSGILTAKP